MSDTSNPWDTKSHSSHTTSSGVTVLQLIYSEQGQDTFASTKAASHVSAQAPNIWSLLWNRP
jgi:hypothetical protein